MDYKYPNKVRREAKSFLAIIEAWPLQITIGDMFAVDITLIFKFISVSTTYLVIMIQVSNFMQVSKQCFVQYLLI